MTCFFGGKGCSEFFFDSLILNLCRIHAICDVFRACVAAVAEDSRDVREKPLGHCSWQGLLVLRCSLHSPVEPMRVQGV